MDRIQGLNEALMAKTQGFYFAKIAMDCKENQKEGIEIINVPRAVLFSEPFRRDLDLIWRLRGITLF